MKRDDTNAEAAEPHNDPPTFVGELCALSERANHLITEGMKHGVHPMLLDSLAQLPRLATNAANIIAVHGGKQIPGGVDFSPRFFTAEELNGWSKRLDKRIRKAPAYPRAQSFALIQLQGAIDGLAAMITMIEAASESRVVDGSGDVSSPHIAGRIHLPGDDPGPSVA